MEYVSITPERIVVSGRTLELEGRGSGLLTSAYRKHVAGWPKFFKMETLSRVAFIASELLPGMDDMPEGQDFREDRAVILFGSTASYSADCAYQATVADAANYYPSPAIFVYTLPNIACGEIAIRRHLRGETAFYVIDVVGLCGGLLIAVAVIILIVEIIVHELSLLFRFGFTIIIAESVGLCKREMKNSVRNGGVLSGSAADAVGYIAGENAVDAAEFGGSLPCSAVEVRAVYGG